MKTRPHLHTWHSPARLALWVALPMAQTSHVEKRLTMILDTTRSRRALTRRVRLTALALAFSVLVPLAMLRPRARAQAASDPANGQAQGTPPVQIVGITDATVPGGGWWSADGKKLLRHPPHPADWSDGTKITTPPGQNGRFFAFRLSAAMQNVPVIYEVSHETLGGLTLFSPGRGSIKGHGPHTVTMKSLQIQTSSSDLIYGAAFPASLSHTSIRVGTSSGLWQKSAVFKFIPIRHRIKAETVRMGSGRILHVPAQSFELFLPVLIPSDKRYDLKMFQASDGFSLSALYAAHREVKIVAIDLAGREVMPASENVSTAQNKIYAHFARSPAQIKEVDIKSRPLVWTEFKDVALQPNPQAASVPAAAPLTEGDPEAATARLQQIYGFLQIYRQTHGGAFPVTNSPGLRGDITVHPQTYGLPNQGAGNTAQALRYFTSPDSQFMINGTKADADRVIAYYIHNKRPDGTLVGTAKRAGTRDVFAYTNLYVRNHAHGATGFYLVLWDDGTVERLPAGSILEVPVYDVIGPAGATEEAARQGGKQFAFPGQAGLP